MNMANVTIRGSAKALLVWPKFESHSFWNFEKVCELVGVKYMTPPLGLLTVAALLPKTWQLRVLDENVEPLGTADLEWADLVFVGSKIVHRDRAIEIIRLAKELGKTVVVGGPDPTISPQCYTSSGADSLCLGEGEVTVPELLADLERGTLRPLYSSSRLPDLARETPAPRFDLIDHRNYLYMGVQYSRGCPHHCEFCNVIDLFSHKFRTKSVEQVLAELDVLYSSGYRGQVDFFDDNLVGHVKSAKQLLRALATWLEEHRYPFHFSTSLTLNIAKDLELLALLRAARFKYFLVGIETPDEKALRAANKLQNVGFSVAEATDAIYRHAGATVHSGLMLGLDGEPEDIADKMIRCIDEACVPWVMAGIVYPLPGTALAKRLEREGRLFAQARSGLSEGARDQISAGLQFKTERRPLSVLDDLTRVMHHAFDARNYYERCASVAVRLDTLPNLAPGWRILLRNIRAFYRLCRRRLRAGPGRAPFWKALGRVATRNPAGLEAFATLSILYIHFESMLPYVYGELEKQRSAITDVGEAKWLAEKIHFEPPMTDATPHGALPLASTAHAISSPPR